MLFWVVTAHPSKLRSYRCGQDVSITLGVSTDLLDVICACAHAYRKYNVNIDFDSYKAYRDSRPHTQPPNAPTNGAQAETSFTAAESTGGILPAASSNANEPPAPYPTSFAHIVELVTTGQPIPGIKDIPNTILTGQGTDAVKAKRRKPWEKDDPPATTSGEEQGVTS